MNRTMRRAARQIGLCAVALMLFCLICRLTVNRSYEIFVPIYPELWDQLEAGELRRGGTAPDVARFGEGRKEGNFLRIPVYPGEPGQTDFELRDGSGEVLLFHVVRVGPLRTVYDPQTGGFSGDSAVLIAVSLFWWAVGLIMGWNYQQARGADFESGGLLKRAKALIPVLVPLFVSAFRIAQDLAMAMEARCYRGGENRTRMHEMKLRRRDFIAFILMAAFLAIIIIEARMF